ncbi:peptide ABC transporter ATP-binding protein [Thalassobaculum fulvum]|uniref:Peptide ABC transporter ATP-binding protein n=1 Tax=Thalassobaculum fulvum TaxID=1633335 RepID=A0A918XP11_9PROT|nr:ABC transporter ATP-binding protein [Thalassobaculum fulvum]GHD40804.1 peptide ABC transporter ATP-binding protein [Thalassobaculum fulvum]
MTEPAGFSLDVENLTVSIPLAAGTLRAVRGISFRVNQGETLCIVGESGCGKSLTSLALMGLLPAKAVRGADRLTLNGVDLTALSERQMSDVRGESMAMIFQEPMTSLNPAYTIGNQLEEALRRHRPVSRAEARERAIHLLEKVGITAAASRLQQYPHQLSGGLRQRVMIAMALMCGPDLLICDEPTTALDVTIQAQILHLLRDLQREFHMAIILITHDLGVVARMADRVAVMYAGEIVETGTAAEVFAAPSHPYTKGLLQCIPIPGRTKRGEHLGSIPGVVPSLIGEIAGCAFANRCPHAADACRSEPPARDLGPGRMVRCVLEPGAVPQMEPA